MLFAIAWLAIAVLMCVGRDVISYFIGPAFYFGGLLSAVYFALAMTLFAWRYGNGRKEMPGIALVVAGCWSLALLTLEPRDVTHQVWEVEGVQAGTGATLTDVHFFHCGEDAIEFSRDFKKQRFQWAMSEDGTYLRGRVKITLFETCPAVENLGIGLGSTRKEFRLWDYDTGQVQGLIDDSLLRKRD
jgi:hypothetical protein